MNSSPLFSSSSANFRTQILPASVCYWGQVFTRAEILKGIAPKDLTTFIDKLRNGEYSALSVDQKYRVTVGGQSWVVMGARISRAKRILFTQHNHQIILLDYLPTHDYHKSAVMNSTWFREFCRKSFATPEFLEQSCEELDVRSPEGLNLRVCENLNHEIVPIWSDKDYFIQLDERQSSITSTRLPVIVQGPPGVGKSIVGRTVLFSEIQRSLDESDAFSERSGVPISCAYTSKARHLVENQRALYSRQAVSSDPRVHIYFWSDQDFYPESQTVAISQVHRWIEARKQGSAYLLQTLSPLELLQELHLLYVLKDCRPQDYAKVYTNDFVRQKLLESPVHIAAMVQLFEDFYEEFLTPSRRPYVEGFRCHDPSPESSLEIIVLDEGQNASLPELWFLMKKTKGYQLLILQDPKQNQRWQGLDTVTLFENLFERLNSLGRKFSERLTLVQNYRCGRDILGYANRVLKLRGVLLEGVTYKGEEPLLTLPLEAEGPLGQVRWVPDWAGESCSEIRDALPEHSTEWAVLTSPEHLEEARRVLGSNTLIFTFDQVPGMEFQAVVLYKGWDRELIAHQNFDDIARALQEDYHLPRNRSVSLRDHAKLIQWSGAYFTAITRARDLVVIIESQPSKKSSKPLKTTFHALIDPLYQNSSRPLSISLAASTQAEWTIFIGNMLQAGEAYLARDLFIREIVASQEQSFEDWCLAQGWAVTENELHHRELVFQNEPVMSFETCTRTTLESDFQRTTPKDSVLAQKKDPASSGNGLLPQELTKYLHMLCDPQRMAEFRRAEKLNHKKSLYDLLFKKAFTNRTEGALGLQEEPFSFLENALGVSRSGGEGARIWEGALLRLAEAKALIILTEDFFCTSCPSDLQTFVQAYVPELLNRPLTVFSALLWLAIRAPNGMGFLKILLAAQPKFHPGKVLTGIRLQFFANLMKPYESGECEDFAPLTPEDRETEGYKSLRFFYQKNVKLKTLNLYSADRKSKSSSTNSKKSECLNLSSEESAPVFSSPSILKRNAPKTADAKGSDWDCVDETSTENELIQRYQKILTSSGNCDTPEVSQILDRLYLMVFNQKPLTLGIQKGYHKFVYWLLLKIRTIQSSWDSQGISSKLDRFEIRNLIPGKWISHYVQFMMQYPEKKKIFEAIILTMIEIGVDLTRSDWNDQDLSFSITTDLVKNCNSTIATKAIQTLIEDDLISSFLANRKLSYTLFTILVKNGNTEAAGLLLKGGVCLFDEEIVSIEDREKTSILTLAIEKGLSSDLIKVILAQLRISQLSSFQKIKILNNARKFKGVLYSNLDLVMGIAEKKDEPLSQDRKDMAMALIEENNDLALSLQEDLEKAEVNQWFRKNFVDHGKQGSRSEILSQTICLGYPDLLECILKTLRAWNRAQVDREIPTPLTIKLITPPPKKTQKF